MPLDNSSSFVRSARSRFNATNPSDMGKPFGKRSSPYSNSVSVKISGVSPEFKFHLDRADIDHAKLDRGMTVWVDLRTVSGD